LKVEGSFSASLYKSAPMGRAMNYELSIINYKVSPTPPLAPPLQGWGITDERSNCEIVKLSNCESAPKGSSDALSIKNYALSIKN
jgi:hypothetical protein